LRLRDGIQSAMEPPPFQLETSRSNARNSSSVTALLTSEGVRVTPDVKDAVWTTLQSLASAPKAERTLTGLG
jgi:type IV secretory pathway VirB4 component